LVGEPPNEDPAADEPRVELPDVGDINTLLTLGGTFTWFSEVVVSGPTSFTLGDRGRGLQLFESVSPSECWIQPTADSGYVFGSSFRAGSSVNSEPRVSLGDNGSGTVFGGVADNGEEWGFGAPGDAGIRVVPIPVVTNLSSDAEIGLDAYHSRIHDGDPDGWVITLTADWQGVATENFSGDRAEVGIQVTCLSVTNSLLEKDEWFDQLWEWGRDNDLAAEEWLDYLKLLSIDRGAATP
jgi:hypothetical protein